MERHPAPATRHIKVAVVDESELVVHGIRAMLEPHGLRPPVFPDYAANMVSFFKEHEDDPAYMPKH